MPPRTAMELPDRVARPEAPGLICDVRGWIVRTLIDDARAGSVHELIGPADAPRYLEIILTAAGRSILAPVGQLRADGAARVIWLPGLAAYQLEALPSHVSGTPDRLTELRLLYAWDAALTGTSFRPSFRLRPQPGETRQADRQEPAAASTDTPVVALSQSQAQQLAENEIDPTGWPVVDLDGALAGTVVDLLADLRHAEVRHAIVVTTRDRPVLVPIELLQLDAAISSCRMPHHTSTALAALPEYRKPPVDAAADTQILERLARLCDERRFYQHARFDPSGLCAQVRD